MENIRKGLILQPLTDFTDGTGMAHTRNSISCSVFRAFTQARMMTGERLAFLNLCPGMRKSNDTHQIKAVR